MIDLAYIIESADYRMFDACPEIMTPDRKPYKSVRNARTDKPAALRISYKKPVKLDVPRGYHSEHLPCERWNGRKAQADISRLTREARAAGMSYGEFMALRRNRKI